MVSFRKYALIKDYSKDMANHRPKCGNSSHLQLFIKMGLAGCHPLPDMSYRLHVRQAPPFKKCGTLPEIPLGYPADSSS